MDVQATSRESWRQWEANFKRGLREKYADVDDLMFEVYWIMGWQRVWLNQQYREAGLGDAITGGGYAKK